jgi:Cu-processing system permease protein
MSPVTVLVLLHKELRDAVRNRWLWLFAVAFGALALALGVFSLSQAGGSLGFSRTSAGLINLVLLLVPLFGLSLGAQSIAGERERRTLAYLLAQPITRAELLLGKYLGLGLGLAAALGLGFGVAGVGLAVVRIDALVYAKLAGLALMLGLAMLALGLMVSVLVRRTAMALGAALFLWFGLVLVADLGLMGTTMMLRLRPDAVLLLALANPLQVFKVAAVLAIRPTLEVLGPAGLYAQASFGPWLGPLLVGVLAAWAVVLVAGAGVVFARRPEP